MCGIVTVVIIVLVIVVIIVLNTVSFGVCFDSESAVTIQKQGHSEMIHTALEYVEMSDKILCVNPYTQEGKYSAYIYALTGYE